LRTAIHSGLCQENIVIRSMGSQVGQMRTKIPSNSVNKAPALFNIWVGRKGNSGLGLLVESIIVTTLLGAPNFPSHLIYGIVRV